jgi:hypothetical protein
VPCFTLSEVETVGEAMANSASISVLTLLQYTGPDLSLFLNNIKQSADVSQILGLTVIVFTWFPVPKKLDSAYI